MAIKNPSSKLFSITYWLKMRWLWRQRCTAWTRYSHTGVLACALTVFSHWLIVRKNVHTSKRIQTDQPFSPFIKLLAITWCLECKYIRKGKAETKQTPCHYNCCPPVSHSILKTVTITWPAVTRLQGSVASGDTKYRWHWHSHLWTSWWQAGDLPARLCDLRWCTVLTQLMTSMGPACKGLWPW